MLAVEIASRFSGETSATEVTDEERDKLSEKYGVEQNLISNALSGLRSVGLYRDKFFHQKHPSATEGLLHPDEVAASSGTKPNETTPPPPPQTSLETSLKPSATEAKDRPNEVFTEELMNRIGKQESMINYLRHACMSLYYALK